jgi:hypothetical protein
MSSAVLAAADPADARVRAGFYAAAGYNIAGTLLFSKGFTNTVLHETDPVLFSVPGCLLICVWGLAYLAQSRSWREGPAVSAVFAVEKLFYATWWVSWLALNAGRLGEIAAADPLAGAFYALYGAGDAAFCLFFAWAALRARS